MEYLDLVDENNNLIGKKEEKSIIHQKGLWHRECAAWPYKENGDVLVQKRVATKKQNPNKWALCAGHVQAGETPEVAMIREIEEEIGLTVKKEELESSSIEKIIQESPNGTINKYFSYRYFVKTNKNINEYTIQEEELSEVKYISLEELEEIVKTGDENYTFSKREYMPKIIEEIKKRVK